MAKRGQRRVSEAEADRAHERFIMRWGTFRDLGGKLIWAAAIVGTAFVVFYLPVSASRGQATAISVTQEVAANVDLHVWIAWGAAATAAVAWKRERSRRLTERNEKDTRIRELEKKIDPNVTSSGLNLEGTKPREGSQ